MTLWVLVVGAFTGLLGGLFGKGGSAVATPLLSAGGIPAFVALASPLPATIPATVVAASAYWRAGAVDVRILRRTVLVGVPATICGALLSALVGGSALVLACDVVVALLGVRILSRQSRTATPVPERVLAGVGGRGPVTRDPEVPVSTVTAVAIAAGLLSGLLANAGGFLLAPLFVTVLGLPLKRALGTSLAAAAVLAVPGTIVHAALGHVDWSVAVPFGLVSVPLSAVGAHIALRTEASRLEVVYGAALVVLGGGLLVLR